MSATPDLQPPRVDLSPTPAHPRGSIPLDTTTALTCWLGLLFVFSERLTVPGMGSLGQPSLLAALGIGLLWAGAWALGAVRPARPAPPLRAAILVYAGYLAVSYVVASTRVLTPLERSGSTRELIILVGLTAIALAATDGIDDRDRLRTLLRRLTTLGALFAAFGVVQTLVGSAMLPTLPGLVWNQDVQPGLLARDGIPRPIGTALHSIEFAVIVSSLVPLAVHFFLHARDRLDRSRAAIECALLAVAIPLSLSRTAIVCLIAGLGLLSLGWTWRRRFQAAFAGLVAVPVVALLVPAAATYTVQLFTTAGEDPSVQDRIDRVPTILGLIRQRPWLGWGHGTYSVEDFLLIDNQLWVTLIATGIIGLLLTLALPLIAGFTAVWHHRELAARGDEEFRHLGFAIAAAIAAITVSTVTFTAFSYGLLTFTLWLLFGCAAAHWQLSRSADHPVELDTGPAAPVRSSSGAPASRS